MGISELDEPPSPVRSAAGLTSAEVAKAREQWGPNVLAKPVVTPLMLFLRQFANLMPIMLIVAAIISAATTDWADLIIILAMIIINALLGFREEMEAKKALDELTASVKSEVPARRDGNVAPVDVEDLVPGDVCLLVGGDKVPADVTWIEGDILSVDTAALTGEPIPRKYPSEDYGKGILAGCTVVAGEAYCYVDKTGGNTELGASQEEILKDKAGGRTISVFEANVMAMVKSVTQCLFRTFPNFKLRRQRRRDATSPRRRRGGRTRVHASRERCSFVTVSVSHRYIIAGSIGLVLIVLFVNIFGRNQWKKEGSDVLDIAVAIIVASIPIALPLIIQVTMAIGAATMAKEHNAVVTSSSALQDIAAMTVLCSDKTGTLTTANMTIKLDMAWVAPEIDGSKFPGRTKALVLEFARLCANPDKADDPIDRAVIHAFEEDKGDAAQATLDARGGVHHRVGFDNTAKRMTVTMESGLVIAKGLSSKCLDTSAGGEDKSEYQWVAASKGIDGGLDGLKKQVADADFKLSKAGYKTIAVVARNNEGDDWEFLGLLPMIDPPRFDTKRTIQNLNHAGVDVKMCTGDHQNIGIETARLIGLSQDIRAGKEIRGGAGPETTAEMIRDAGGFAEVLPRDKREVVLTLRNKFNNVVGMTGDGVNDAPALSSAQVGIAVDGATDAAKGAAAIILTTPGLSAIFGGLVESRKIFARLKSYIQYRFAATFHIVTFLCLLTLYRNCSLKPLYVILLALFNDLTLTPVSKDYADASKDPVDPRLKPIIILAVVYAIVYVAGSLIYYELATNSGLELLSRSNKLHFVTRKGIHTCTRYVQAALFLEIGLCAEFLIFSARAPGVFFMSRPSPYLMLGTAIGAIVLSLLVRFANGFGDLTGTDVIYCWIYSIIIFLLADCAKLIFIASFHITSGVLEELPDDHEEHENEEHLHEDHKELLQGKRGSVHKRPKVAATNPGGLKGLLTHGNTRDAGMAIYPSLEDASFKHLTGPQKVAKRAQRRSSRGSVVSY